MEAKAVPLTPDSILNRSAAIGVDKPPFRHFSTDLGVNTQFLATYLLDKERELRDADSQTALGAPVPGDSTGMRMWEDSGSLPTVAWRDYNVFQFHNPALYDLLRALGDLTREACEYYGVDFEKQRYMIQGWFNVNTRTTGKLDWHRHSHWGVPHFHGYYCVNAEPSSTWYNVNGSQLMEVVNRNNRAILGESLHEHAMGDWDWDGPRITVAYDVSPLSGLQRVHEQHYVPLP